jgi:hypothetical protein
VVVGSCSLGEISSARPSSYERKQTATQAGEGKGEVICIRLTPPCHVIFSASVHAFETEKGKEWLLLFSQAQTSQQRTSHLALSIIYLEHKAQTQRHETAHSECEDTNSSPCQPDAVISLFALPILASPRNAYLAPRSDDGSQPAGSSLYLQHFLHRPQTSMSNREWIGVNHKLLSR